MKILYFFPEYGTPMFQWQRLHFIDELSRHGIDFETFNPLIYSSPAEANELFVKRIKQGGFELLMSSVCYEGIIYSEVPMAAKNQGIPSLLIRWDNLTVPIYDKKQSKLFDLVWLTSRETSNMYKKWGANYIIQPYAASPYAFNYNEEPLNRNICFLGTPYGSRSLMINALTQASIDVDAYYGGNKTISNNEIRIKYDIPHPSHYKMFMYCLSYREGRKMMMGAIKNKIVGSQTIIENAALHHFPAVPVSEVSSIYSSHSVCLASTSTNHTDSLKKPLKIVNLRSFEIPMSGGLALCKYNSELAEYFEEGKEILFYQTNDELIEKARNYSKVIDDVELRRMKMAARKRAEAEHTWWCRFSKAFDALGLKY